jgi:hypothetical protein
LDHARFPRKKLSFHTTLPAALAKTGTGRRMGTLAFQGQDGAVWLVDLDGAVMIPDLGLPEWSYNGDWQATADGELWQVGSGAPSKKMPMLAHATTWSSGRIAGLYQSPMAPCGLIFTTPPLENRRRWQGWR